VSFAHNNFPETTKATDGNYETNAITSFANDAEVKEASPEKYSPFKRLYQKSTDGYFRDIANYLATPIPFDYGNLSTTDTVSTFVPRAMPRAVINGTPMWSAKLKGFLGIRCDIVLKLQVNAMPFQQGRYMLCWVPLGGTIDQTTRINKWYFAHTNTLVQRTQLPHVELDINTDTEVTLRIPYNSITNFLDVDSLINGVASSPTLGTYQLFPYSPLVAASGSTTASYTIWVSLENVELIGAAIPQMGTEEEQKSKDIGPVQDASTKVFMGSMAMMAFPPAIPVAIHLAWTSAITMGVSSIFGWSKPANLDRTYYVQRQGLHQVGNADTADNSQVISYSSANQVETAGGYSGTMVDELDFLFLATTPAYVYQFAWNTSQVASTQIFSSSVSPNTCIQMQNGSGTNQVTHFPPCGFVSQFFTYWRGSVVFKLKFVKTGFHSGRIAISY
jgi:hypothetical protein